MTTDELEKLREAAMPLMAWLAKNCHPHVQATVDSEQVILYEGIASVGKVTREPNT